MGERLARPFCLVAMAGLGLVAGAASGQPATATRKAFVVTMQIAGFEPQVATVKSGDRVTWVYKDLFPHTATAEDKTFDSHSVAPSGTWTFVAGRPGTYTYTCIFHPTMKGTIKVE